MRVLLYIWVNKHGGIKTEKVKFGQLRSNEEVLLDCGPTNVRISRWEKQGYSLCNWHIIEDNTSESRSVVI